MLLLANFDQAALGAVVASFLAAFLVVLMIGHVARRVLASAPEVLEAAALERANGGLLRAGWILLSGLCEHWVRQGDRFPKLRARARLQLVQSGAPKERTPEIWLGRNLAQGILITVVFCIVRLVMAGTPGLVIGLALGAGWALVWQPHQLKVVAEDRVREVSRKLPFMVDLSALVLEAGGTLRDALVIASQGRDEDALTEELRMVLAGMDAGQSQAKALEDFAERMKLEDLTTLVLALNRGEEMGTPMSKTLATQAELMRFRRYERAEKLAQEAPVKMMLPNMLIMFATLLVVLGPALLKIMTDGML